LSDEAVIRRVTTSFVPVAANLYKVRAASDSGGELFRSVQRQKDQYQGVWIVTPDGKVLAAIHDYQAVKDQERLKLSSGEVKKRMSQELLAVIDQALAAFGPVPARDVRADDPLPCRGRGVQPDGSVTLAIYLRQMMGGGRETAPPNTPAGRLWVWDGALRPDGPPVIDSLVLDAQDWATFAPPNPELGSTWTVRDAVARQFCRVLVPSSDQAWMPRPADSKQARLAATVESVKDGLAQIRLSGVWEAVHLTEGDPARPVRGTATAEGIVVYDLKGQAIQSVLLVFSGAHGHANEDAASACGAVVEWRR
jgi:hypothetical protein